MKKGKKITNVGIILYWLRTLTSAVALLAFCVGLSGSIKNFISLTPPTWSSPFRAFGICVVSILAAAFCEYMQESVVTKHDAILERWARKIALAALLDAEPTKAAVEDLAVKDKKSTAMAASVGALGKNQGRGALISQLTDGAESIANFRAAFLGPTIAAFTAPFLVLIFMAVFVDPVIAGVVLLFVLLVPVIIGLFMKRMRKSGMAFARSSAKVSALFLETFEALGVLRLLQAGARRREQLAKASEDLRKNVMALLVRNQLMIVVNDTVFALAMITVASVLAIWRFGSGAITFSQALCAILLTVLLHEPIDRIGRSFYVAMGGLAQEKALNKVVEKAREAKMAAEAKPWLSAAITAPLSAQENLVVDNVTVARGDKDIINQCSFTLQPGQHLAIVGPSGSGKSTLVSALTGELALKTGQISWGDRQLDPASLRALTTVIRQQPTIFSGTIAENLRLAKADATDEELWQVLQQAHLDEEVRQMPAGLESEVGEKGALLSGGQARRLSLARALLKPAPILVMDEPTADLDRKTESQVVATLAAARVQKTTITIAHRLRTIDGADKVLVIDGGRIVYAGSYEEAKAAEEGYINRALEAEDELLRTLDLATKTGDSLEQHVNTNSEEAAARGVSAAKNIGQNTGHTNFERDKQNDSALLVGDEEPKSTKRRLGALARKYALFLTITTTYRVLSLLAFVAILALPAWYVGTLLVSPAHPGMSWGKLVTTMILLGLAKGLLRYAEQLSGHFVAFHVLADLRLCMFDGVYQQDPAVVEEQGTGRLLNTATGDIDRLEVFYAHTIAPAIATVVVPTVVFIWVWVSLGWAPALALLVGVVFGGAVSPLIGARSSRKYAQEIGKLRKDLTQSITETVSGRIDIAQFGAEAQRKAQADEISGQVVAVRVASGKRQGVRMAIAHAWPLLTAVLLVAACFGVNWSGLELSQNIWSPLVSVEVLTRQLPYLLAAIGAVMGLAPALAGVTSVARSLPGGIAAARRLFTLVDTPPLVSDPEPQAQEKLQDGPLELHVENVDFSYVENRQVLGGVDLTVKPGQMVAVVGATGSGKSTIASLAARVRDVDGGRITLQTSADIAANADVDGAGMLAGAALSSVSGSSSSGADKKTSGKKIDIRNLALADLRGVVGLVPQRGVLLRGTLAENLRLGAPAATDEQLEKICQLVGIDLQGFAAGLQTLIAGTGAALNAEEMGTFRQLSGGEAQRVCIARTLLTSPRILILDEATSHQDALTQAQVMENLRAMNLGILVIAHRLATIKNADVIHVLDQGQIVESGTWQQLVEKQGAFAHLLAAAE